MVCAVNLRKWVKLYEKLTVPVDGDIEGSVCILKHLEEGHLLQSGEILVAATTNIGWTPLFPRAAAHYYRHRRAFVPCRYRSQGAWHSRCGGLR
nr:hypothetical protein [Desulforamulus ruminis]